MTTKGRNARWRIKYIALAVAAALVLAGLVRGARWLNEAPSRLVGPQDARVLCPGDVYSVTYDVIDLRTPFTAYITVGWSRVSPNPTRFVGKLVGATTFTGDSGEARTVTADGLITPNLTPGKYSIRVTASFLANRGISSFDIPVTIPPICPIPKIETPEPLPAPPAQE